MRFSFTTERIPLSAGDWFILGALGALFAVGTYWLLATIYFRFTTEVPARGGAMTEGIVGTPRFINPVLAISDADRDATELLFAGLMHPTLSGMQPDLAEGYTLSDDRRTYTFTLRPDAVFHDGTRVTADDVAFTIARIQDPAIKSPKRPNWEGVAVAVSDERTISFTLREPYAPFLDNTDVGIIPKRLWDTVRPDEFPFSKLNVEPVGAGPFRVQRLVTNASGIPERLDLTAFSRAIHPPFIESYTLRFFSDPNALALAVSRDSTLAAHSITPEMSAGQRAYDAVFGRVFAVFFNQNENALFASRAVRSALDAALDKEALVRTLIGGYGSVAVGPLPKESSADNTPWSADRAASILAADGWLRGEDGIWTKTVKKSTTRLAFTLTTSNAPELKQAAELVADSWRALGADVTVAYFDQNDLQQDVIRPRKYDALLFGIVVGRDADLFAFWDSSQRNDPGLNIALYTNADVDAILRKTRTAEDPTERTALAEKAADIIAKEVAAVFLYTPHFLYLTDPRVRGVTLDTIVTPADRFASITDWYIDTERIWPIFR
ncbi:hypothetical protein KGO06_01405 [Patescibacteria group bacterium]|nr:hypothetical protein [Patescibacteria group bacterium]